MKNKDKKDISSKEKSCAPCTSDNADAAAAASNAKEAAGVQNGEIASRCGEDF